MFGTCQSGGLRIIPQKTQEEREIRGTLRGNEQILGLHKGDTKKTWKCKAVIAPIRGKGSLTRGF